jgi:hypothetical protein
MEITYIYIKESVGNKRIMRIKKEKKKGGGK